MSTLFKVLPLYSDDERSVARVELDGIGPAVVNNKSDTTYRVLEGLGQFRTLNRNTLQLDVMEVAEGSEVFIPKGTIYADMGKLVMEVTCVPPYDPSAIRIVQDVIYV